MYQEERLQRYGKAIDDLADALFDARMGARDYRGAPDLLHVATALVDLMTVAGHERGLLEATRLESYALHGPYQDDPDSEYDDVDDVDDEDDEWDEYPGHGAG